MKWTGVECLRLQLPDFTRNIDFSFIFVVGFILLTALSLSDRSMRTRTIYMPSAYPLRCVGAWDVAFAARKHHESGEPKQLPNLDDLETVQMANFATIIVALTSSRRDTVRRGCVSISKDAQLSAPSKFQSWSNAPSRVLSASLRHFPSEVHKQPALVNRPRSRIMQWIFKVTLCLKKSISFHLDCHGVRFHNSILLAL